MSRDLCDAQTLPSPGRWPVKHGVCPDSQLWQQVSSRYVDIAPAYGSDFFVIKLGLGQVTTCPFSDQSVAELKVQVVQDLEHAGLSWKRSLKGKQQAMWVFSCMQPKTQKCGWVISPKE